MKFNTKHKALDKLVFYQDIRDYFFKLKGYREFNQDLWHESGTHYYRVTPISTTPTDSSNLLVSVGTSRDPRYAVVELWRSSVGYYFDSRWGHSRQDELICKMLIAPRTTPPRPAVVEFGTNTITVQGGTTWIGVDGTTVLSGGDAATSPQWMPISGAGDI